ncbi:hypothetical protein Tco_0297080, partial [Tanacetum coccineum]
PDPDVALELGKSISLTEAKEKEAVRQAYATHTRIVTESVPETARRRPSGKVTSNPPKKLKSGSGSKPNILDESIVVSATSSEGTSTKPGVPDEEKVTTEEKVILEWRSKQESEYSNDDNYNDDDDDENKSIDLELTNDEETDDKFVHSGEYVQTDDEYIQGEEQVNDD